MTKEDFYSNPVFIGHEAKNKNCFQLFERIVEKNHAGSKAPLDSKKIAESFGFETIYFFYWGERKICARITGQIFRCFEYFLSFFRLRRNSILFVQFPFVRGGKVWRVLFFKFAKLFKNVKIISLIHDINELRYSRIDAEKKLLTMLIKYSDKIITHNEKMSAYLINVRGVGQSKLVPLGLFDYLVPSECGKKDIHFERAISIAGNLDQNKCAYLRRLPELKDIPFHLYGLNYSDYDCPNIIYHGVFDSAEIISKLKHGFGLVWDGESLDTCSGLYGNYLKYNNPHKLSMYLTAGLPVVVWEQSALKDFVISNNLGISAISLNDAIKKINSITKDEYVLMHENCVELSKQLRAGHFLKTALFTAVNQLPAR